MGYLDLRADVQPSSVERRNAMAFSDASTDRHAPDQSNPVKPTEANLIAGLRLYTTHCAACHGAPDHPERKFGHPFYPPAPLFTEDAPDMPENQNFYIIRHGVRWSGMPAWENTLSYQQMWTLVTFLSHMQKLPPAVERVWGQPTTPIHSGGESKHHD
jgi:mono/diheme cytochrome c family protein